MKTGEDQVALRSPHMEQVAKALATAQGINWAQKGAQLTLAMPGRTERWLLLNLDGDRFSLTCCLVELDETLIPEVDMVFTMHSDGWEPIELLYSHEAFAIFAQAVQATGVPIYDAEDNLHFDAFTEYWARQLKEQGWLEHGRPVSDQEEHGRMTGCQSTNHTVCYGELWQCVACGKIICYAEGTDDRRELCDECWTTRQTVQQEDEALRKSDSNHRSLTLVCDCPAQCGTRLALTHDGFLILEDRDGLQVSFMLPDWLDHAVRKAWLMQSAVAEDELADQPLADPMVGCLDDEVPF